MIVEALHRRRVVSKVKWNIAGCRWAECIFYFSLISIGVVAVIKIHDDIIRRINSDIRQIFCIEYEKYRFKHKVARHGGIGATHYDVM